MLEKLNIFHKTIKCVKKRLFGDRLYPHILRAIKKIKAVKEVHEKDLVKVDEKIKVLQAHRRAIKACIKDYEKILTKLKEELED